MSLFARLCRVLFYTLMNVGWLMFLFLLKAIYGTLETVSKHFAPALFPCISDDGLCAKGVIFYICCVYIYTVKHIQLHQYDIIVFRYRRSFWLIGGKYTF